MMKNVFLSLSLLLPLLLMASERSVNDAAMLAAEFMNEQYEQAPLRKASCNASSFMLAHTRAKLNSQVPAFYVFNQSNENGYIIVSADDRTEDVLVYSDEGTFDPENINPNFRFWLSRLQEELSAANDENTYTAAEKKARKATAATAISPLLVNQDGEEIAWYQEEPYWNQCPMDLWKTKERCLTGCVATAAAQIMYKWRYPATGTGSHSYTWECCMNSQCSKTSSQELSMDFSQVTFDWDNILANYNSGKSGTTAQKNAVATLMYCCGVACDMEYGGETIGGSGAWTDDMGYGMTQYFGYTLDKFITSYSKSSYQSAKGTSIALSNCEWSVSTSDFTKYFNQELEVGRPILMGGEDSDGGHEFVCDGRNTSGYFHINWGWEGESNNYCKLSALKPSGTSYDFSSEIDALIGLQPGVIDTVHVTDVTVAPTILTLKQKEKATLTATVTPIDATFKTVTWSSSDSAIATVSNLGVVTGVAEGNATITATSKEGDKKATCTITVTDEVIEFTDCETYDYEFTRDEKYTTGSNQLGDYTWTITLQKGSIGEFDTRSERGQAFGSRNSACGQASLTTADVADCLLASVKVNAAISSQGDGKLTVFIGNTQIGKEQKLTSTATDYIFFNTAYLQGNLEIRLTNSSKAMYVKTINLNTEPMPTALEQIESTTNSKSKIQNSKFLLNGQLYINCSGHLFNAQGQLVR